jgi:hypothetical protein
MTKQEERAKAEHPSSPHLAHLAAQATKNQEGPTEVKAVKMVQAGCDILAVTCPRCRQTFGLSGEGQAYCSCGLLIWAKE